MKPRPEPLVPMLITLILLSGIRAASAEVRDNAGFFSEDVVRQANFDLRDVKQRHGKDLLIETHPTIPADMRAQLEQLGKHKFFEQWTIQRANAAKLDGAAVLITKDPPHLHVVVNKQTSDKAFTLQDRQKLQHELLASFPERQYDQGLLSAVNVWRQTLERNLATSGAAAAPVERSPGAGAGAGATAARSSSEPQPNPGAFEPRGRNARGPAGDGGGGISFFKLVIWGIVILIIVRVIGKLLTRRHARHQQPGGLFGTGGRFGRGRYGRHGGVDPRYGDPRYGDPRYGGGMGGFGTGLGGGLLGGLLGGWIGGRMFGGGGGESTAHGAPPPATGGNEPGVFADQHDANFARSGFDAGGGDFGSGGDFSGGDSGGGDF